MNFLQSFKATKEFEIDFCNFSKLKNSMNVIKKSQEIFFNISK